MKPWLKIIQVMSIIIGSYFLVRLCVTQEWYIEGPAFDIPSLFIIGTSFFNAVTIVRFYEYVSSKE
ncbi:hypothetical protein EPH95_02615 [Salicibibacter halophilus]|uniref:Uncharacterized protein n=1 Tax=Salicibibacter halophilus TaxID=2502791 RepID=A0A514LED8_9BACI|nr:hypothetical protein [Salicibibacter halophilus]QDI90199.1 hypothetical protein EPH95_02615 [Salicibibacter halophilus]